MIGEDEGGNTALLDGRDGGDEYSVRPCVFKGSPSIAMAPGDTMRVVALSPPSDAPNLFIMFVVPAVRVPRETYVLAVVIPAKLDLTPFLLDFDRG